jgi:DNA-binding transcriptional regulator YiaG
MDHRDVSELVKQLRDRMGLTQEQFAREVGVVFSTVNLWENGRRRPQPFLMRRLFEMNQRFMEKGNERSKKKRSR